jgi:hypothetical protein
LSSTTLSCSVEHRDLLGHVDRVPDREQERGGRDAQARGARGDCGEQQQRRRNRAGVAEVVLREPEGAVAETLRELALIRERGSGSIVLLDPRRRSELEGRVGAHAPSVPRRRAERALGTALPQPTALGRDRARTGPDACM